MLVDTSWYIEQDVDLAYDVAGDMAYDVPGNMA